MWDHIKQTRNDIKRENLLTPPPQKNDGGKDYKFAIVSWTIKWSAKEIDKSNKVYHSREIKSFSKTVTAYLL